MSVPGNISRHVSDLNPIGSSDEKVKRQRRSDLKGFITRKDIIQVYRMRGKEKEDRWK